MKLLKRAVQQIDKSNQTSMFFALQREEVVEERPFRAV
jgi:hypothetical protein